MYLIFRLAVPPGVYGSFREGRQLLVVTITIAITIFVVMVMASVGAALSPLPPSPSSGSHFHIRELQQRLRETSTHDLIDQKSSHPEITAHITQHAWCETVRGRRGRERGRVTSRAESRERGEATYRGEDDDAEGGGGVEIPMCVGHILG